MRKHPINLHTPLVLVLGHESCGAVTAALEEERVHRGVEANVRRSMHQLEETAELKDRIETDQLKIVAAVYELKTGKVRLLK